VTAPHLARRRDYPDFVKTATATTHEEGGASFRTVLHVVFHTGRGVGAFIGANPSRALDDGSDATVNKVLRWMHAQGVAEVYVFNLSPYRATDAADAVRWLSEPDNLALSDRVNAVAHAKLDELLSAATPPLILAGWGDCLKRHVREFVWPSLPLNVERPLVYHLPLTKAGNPGHPLYADLRLITSRRGLP
jgi:hypothetical protein